MSLTYTVTDDGGVIRLKGRFDFSGHQVFRTATADALTRSKVPGLLLDLGGVDYMDSSSLGMLLILKDQTKAVGKSVSLTGASGVVKQVIGISNFDKIFSVS